MQRRTRHTFILKSFCINIVVQSSLCVHVVCARRTVSYSDHCFGSAANATPSFLDRSAAILATLCWFYRNHLSLLSQTMKGNFIQTCRNVISEFDWRNSPEDRIKDLFLEINQIQHKEAIKTRMFSVETQPGLVLNDRWNISKQKLNY